MNKVYNKSAYEIYHGISGSDFRISQSNGCHTSRITNSSVRRFFSNEDYYCTCYFITGLTEIEALYIESNLFLFGHQEKLQSKCLNKIQSVLCFPVMDIQLVELAVFLISEKMCDGSNVYGLRMNDKNERTVLQLDNIISKLKHNGTTVADVADLTPILERHSMVSKLNSFSCTEIGSQFEHLDNVFQRELLNASKFTISSDKFIALIDYFNQSENYAKRISTSFPDLFSSKYNGLLEKYFVCNSKTSFWVAIIEFFKTNKTPTLLKEYNELSFGSLLYLLFIKASLFCSIDKVFTVGGELLANITNARHQDKNYMKTSNCESEDCQLTFQLTIHNQFVILLNDGASINLGYIVQPKQGKPDQYCTQKLHTGSVCSALNIDNFGNADYIRITQADSLVLWIEKFNCYQMKRQKSAIVSIGTNVSTSTNIQQFEKWLSNVKLFIVDEIEPGNIFF